MVSGLVTGYILPSNPPEGNFLAKAKNIDFYGLALSSLGIVFLLIPISGGGAYFAWSSPMVITMLSVGGVSSFLFLLVEWKTARLPLIPRKIARCLSVCLTKYVAVKNIIANDLVRLFRITPVSAILAQNYLFGIVYYSELYYLPIYYQNVRGWNPLIAAALTIPLVVGQSLMSILTGLYISKTKRYGGVIWLGYILWTLGTGLKCIFNRRTHPVIIVGILIIEGCGVGCVFQPSMIRCTSMLSKAANILR